MGGGIADIAAGKIERLRSLVVTPSAPDQDRIAKVCASQPRLAPAPLVPYGGTNGAIGARLNVWTTVWRRTFLKAGAAGMALSLGGGALGAPTQGHDTYADLGVVTVGVDGSELTSAIVDKYLSAGASVWLYDVNLAQFPQILTFLDREPRVRLAKTHADILGNKAAGKLSMVVGWQNSVALEEAAGNDWRNSRPPVTQLRQYYELGLRVAGLCYNLSNSFGGGMLDPEASLTLQGKFIVGQMQDMGIVVDCAGHTGERTALDIIKMARRPVVASHANADGLNLNPRNVSDAVIEGIARTGGLVGVTAMDCFMTWGPKDAPRAETGPFPPRANVARMVDEFDYIKRLVGIDHVAIGADFVSDLEPADPGQSFQFPPEMSYKQSPTLKYIEGFESVSDIANVRAEMERRGYSKIEIAKVLGGNWMRVFRDAWNT